MWPALAPLLNKVHWSSDPHWPLPGLPCSLCCIPCTSSAVHMQFTCKISKLKWQGHRWPGLLLHTQWNGTEEKRLNIVSTLSRRYDIFQSPDSLLRVSNLDRGLASINSKKINVTESSSDTLTHRLNSHNFISRYFFSSLRTSARILDRCSSSRVDDAGTKDKILLNHGTYIHPMGFRPTFRWRRFSRM